MNVCVWLDVLVCGVGWALVVCVVDTESRALIGKYTYLKVVGCGHDVLGCKQAQTYIDAIIKNIQQ